MKNSLLVAQRELMERLRNRSFRNFLFLGPFVLLMVIFVILKIGDQGKANLKVLIADPVGVFEGKISSKKMQTLSYFFINDYVPLADFKSKAEFKSYDVLIEVNEKVLINKMVKVLYKDKLNIDTKMQIKSDVERRTEEVMIEQFTNLPVDKFRQLKQALDVDFRDVNDPYNAAENQMSWLGFALGSLILIFIGVFGFGLSRSISREKANRVSEIILASVKSQQLMLGKVLGFLAASVLQILCWGFVLWLGLYLIEQFWFHDAFNAEHLTGVQMTDAEWSSLNTNGSGAHSNAYSDLFFNQINYAFLGVHFIGIFLITYFLYASIFTSVGSISQGDSDGQQFVFPILILLFTAAFSAYYTVNYPDSFWSTFFSYFPWTSGVSAMVRLCEGVTTSQYGFLVLGQMANVLIAWLGLRFSARIFKKGILKFDSKKSFSLWRKH